MNFGKSILSPNYFRNPDFTSRDSRNTAFKFVCANCQNELEVEYKSLIGEEWCWESNFDEKSLSEIKQFYLMNVVGKSPTGGFPAVIEFSCHHCQKDYLIYAGVDESSNSFYVVTLHGITEIIKD
jgi:transposase-like protein